MQQKFRIFVQRHANGTYTVTVPGLYDFSVANPWEDDAPAAPRVAAHGLILEEAKDDLRVALAKWLPKVDPAVLHRAVNYREEQSLEKVDVELRPSDRHGRKRHDRLRLRFSLMVEKEESGQYLVRVPKLLEPPLAFYCYSLEELKEVAARELASYFSATSLEELLEYEYQRQEYLDEIEVSYAPLKPQQEKKRKEEAEESSFWALRASGVNLTARVQEGRLKSAYRREREVNEILNILAGERSQCVMLVGAPGVGKTAILHEVARRIRGENCPAPLVKRQVWYTSAAQLLAGCSYLGQWQEKLKNVIDEVKKRRHILFIEDAVDLLDAGRHSKGDDNMAQLMKPFIADGTLLIVAETTPERFRGGENRDAGFTSLFRTIEIAETNEENTLSVLTAVAGVLEREFNLRLEPAVLQAAVELTRRFQPYRAFPGKAIAFLEQLAADTRRSAAEERMVVSRQYAVAAFARQTGLPEIILSDHLTLDPDGVERYFAERLIGQPDAVRTMVDLITVIKAGMNDPNKPLGCFFFVGPTGVGKTEMAKLLAEYLFGGWDRIIRFDMSEYAELLNVARLIGSAHGDQQGELTKRICLQPFSVVLLDEFEKAHPSIFDVMLQVLGEGRLTDAGGRTADFRSAIVLMTSNLGASPREQKRLGLRADVPRAAGTHFRKQVEDFFRPEFVNRLDQIVVFNPLDREAMRRIALREIGMLLQREGITRRGLLLEIDDAVVGLLLETGFSPVYGARPLKRAIERRIMVPLARYIVGQRITGSPLIRIERVDDTVQLAVSTLAAARQRVQRAGGPLAAGEPEPRSMDLKALVEGFAAQRLRLDRWAAGNAVREIENEWKKLLGRTRRRNFVSHGPEAAKVWTRIYQLERLTKRLAQLKDRAEYLEEFAGLAHRERIIRYQPDLAQSYTELRRDADYLEIELLCAHLAEAGHALLRIAAVGRQARPLSLELWLCTLGKMYLRSVKRKGYDFGVLVPLAPYQRWLEERRMALKKHVPDFDPGPPARPPWVEVKAPDFPALLKRLEELEVSEFAISVKGPNAYGFLKGEAGAHKLLLRGEEPDPAAPFQTAAITVESLADDAFAREHLIKRWEEQQKAKAEGKKPSNAPAPEIVRLYCPEGDRYVRDTRTDVRTTLVRDVLEGDLDPFILAYLKSEEAAVAWEGDAAKA
jgi:ATP-dependent Clp protease ATP-binding subunit ClpC